MQYDHDTNRGAASSLSSYHAKTLSSVLDPILLYLQLRRTRAHQSPPPFVLCPVVYLTRTYLDPTGLFVCPAYCFAFSLVAYFVFAFVPFPHITHDDTHSPDPWDCAPLRPRSKLQARSTSSTVRVPIA